MQRVSPILERKINRFLEKRGLKQEVKDYWKAYNNIDDALKDGRITQEQLNSGDIPEDIKSDLLRMHQLGYSLSTNYNKHINEILTTHGKDKLKEEFDSIDKEIDTEIEKETFINDGRAKLEEAKARYKNNPTNENMRKIIAEEVRLRKSQAAQTTSSDATGVNALREKVFKDAVNAKREGRKLKEEFPGKYLDKPDRLQHNEERVAFEEATTAAANEPETPEGAE